MGGSRTAATSKTERFVIIVNSFHPLIIITKRSNLDVAAVLDPPLIVCNFPEIQYLNGAGNDSNCVSTASEIYFFEEMS